MGAFVGNFIAKRIKKKNNQSVCFSRFNNPITSNICLVLFGGEACIGNKALTTAVNSEFH
jgi:hypothetical protein